MNQRLFLICDNNLKSYKMDFSTCNKCSSEKLGSLTNGFPKKLLVAICVVLIIAMCLTPAEAGSLHRTRHEKNKEERMKTTKVSHHKPKNVGLHTMLARKIIKKLKNTRRFFEEARHEVRDSMEHRYGNPKWLPKVKFIDIHNQTYANLENGMSKDKFEYVVPRLYKSLLQFKLVWERLAEVNIIHLDREFQMNYTVKRKFLIRKTLEELVKLLTEIEDAMDKADITKPHINTNKLNLEDLKKDNVETTRCLRQDTIAIRAYGNILKKWYWELRCPDDSNAKLTEQCRKVTQTLFSKRKAPGKLRQHKRLRRHQHFIFDQSHR